MDLGCGTGELTAAAVDRLGATDALGIDASPAMLEAAAGHARPGLRFELGDISGWTSAADHDLVLANASLQWVPDHAGVLARWIAALAPGGVLAVQVPANADHPSHTVADEVGHEARFVRAMGGEVPPDAVATTVLAPESYALLLHEHGVRDVHVRLQVYVHELAATRDVVEWMRGTALTRFLSRLPGDLHEPFVDAYRQRLLAVLGERSPYLYPFKRILMVGRRS